MIADIENAANAVGIRAIVTDSQKKIAVQLNSLTKDEDLPIMLISWDMVSKVEFDTNGFLKAPKTDITYLLLKKPEILTKDDYRDCSEEMQLLFYAFIQELYPLLSSYRRSIEDKNISNIECMLVPVKKPSHHSGCTGKFTMINGLNRVC